jgi:perosamine synthetase
MKRFLAPVGVRLSTAQLLRTAAVLCMESRKSHVSLCKFGASLGVKHVFGASSARAALCLTLKALHQLEPERDVVALPAYTCFSVAAAVVRAGLKIHPVDVAPETLDFDYREIEDLPSARLLCVITANLFGIVNDVFEISRVAHSKGAFVIDDAAQSLGAMCHGRPSGAAADVGIFSLGRGKPLPAGEGGLIVTDSSKIVDALSTQTESWPACSPKRELVLFLTVLASSIFLLPSLYWIPNSMKFLKLGVTEFNPTFPIGKLSRVSKVLLSPLLGFLPDWNQSRGTKASQLASALGKNPDFSIPGAPRGCQPTYLRFPLLAKNQATRDRAVYELWRAGIGATPFYPSAICDIEGISQYMAVPDFHRPGAEEISRRLLTLPTHALVQAKDVQRMASILGCLLKNCGETQPSALTAGATL